MGENRNIFCKPYVPPHVVTACITTFICYLRTGTGSLHVKHIWRQAEKFTRSIMNSILAQCHASFSAALRPSIHDKSLPFLYSKGV